MSLHIKVISIYYFCCNSVKARYVLLSSQRLSQTQLGIQDRIINKKECLSRGLETRFVDRYEAPDKIVELRFFSVKLVS